MRLSYLLIYLCSISSLTVYASNFNVNITVGGNTVTQSYDTAEDVIDAVKKNKLETTFTNYTETSGVSAVLDFRGLPVNLTYAANSTTLILSIPSLNINETFSGITRDAANDSFEDWLKENGGETVNKIMKKLAEVSPNDPIAGNPNSLMGSMVANEFSSAASDADFKADQSNDENTLALGARFSSYTSGGIDSDTFTLPLGYTFKFDFDPRQQLKIRMPITYSKVGDAESYNISLGLAYRYPINDNWSITPSIGTGVVGSIDLASAGQVLSTSATSTYIHQIENYTLTVANMLGYYQTVKVKVGDYESDPDIQNTVLRNGVLFSIPHMISSWKSESEFFIIDTRYFGTSLFIEEYQEIGYSLGTDKTAKDLSQYLRVGLSYLYNSKGKGFSLNFGYSF